MKHPSTRIFALGLISLVLAGCASTKDTVSATGRSLNEGHL